MGDNLNGKIAACQAANGTPQEYKDY